MFFSLLALLKIPFFPKHVNTMFQSCKSILISLVVNFFSPTMMSFQIFFQTIHLINLFICTANIFFLFPPLLPDILFVYTFSCYHNRRTWWLKKQYHFHTKKPILKRVKRCILLLQWLLFLIRFFSTFCCFSCVFPFFVFCMHCIHYQYDIDLLAYCMFPFFYNNATFKISCHEYMSYHHT